MGYGFNMENTERVNKIAGGVIGGSADTGTSIVAMSEEARR